MAIFSRRTIQRLIDENSKFLKLKQTKKHVNKLNLEKHIQKLNEGNNINELIRDYLNTEWEIVSLNVFSKFGTVIHEPKLEKSTKKIDILFTSTEHNFEFLGDITCITGKQDKDNILLSFNCEFKKIIDQNNLGGCWHIHVGGNNREVNFLKSKPKLRLVGKRDFQTKIFDTKKFVKFIENIKNSPEKKHRYNQRTEEGNKQPLKSGQINLYENEIINLNIEYEPTPYYQILTSHFDDRKIANVYEDEIYKSLKRKRDEQLSETDYAGYLGIILCDGLGGTFSRGDLLHPSSRDVIYSFLYTYPEISFVLTLTSAESSHYAREPVIMVDFYEGESANKLDTKVIKMLKEVLIKEFPKPARTVHDARKVLKYTFENKQTIFSADYCGTSVSPSEIRVSAKKMLELLSGKLSWEKVFYHLGFERVIGSSLPNTFLEMLSEGKLISNAGIEKRGFEIDDDWLVFKFDEQDPAISPFKVPDTNK
jgi:hypothetical protein